MASPRWSLALVTGASSGIGDALARRLAADGTNLAVVARDEARLRALAEEVTAAHGVTVEVLPADLADPEALATVERRLGEDPPVDLLVNNAGITTSGDFVTLDPDVETRMVAVNVTALMRLTRAALPPMIERGRGSVMNISSLGSLQPLPSGATYAATKAFVTSFSEAIHEELRGTGVVLTAVLPGFTHTELVQRAGAEQKASGIPGLVWQSAEAVAGEALDGTAAGRAVVVPGALNKVTAALTGPTPRSVKRRLMGVVAKRL